MTTMATPAFTGTYVLDPANTRLGFVAHHAVGPKVRGTFATFDGQAYLDAADPERSTAEVTIDAASLHTHNTQRDRHLRSGFFDTAHHPAILFRSTSVDRLEDRRVRLTGELTIRGNTRPLTMEVIHTGVDQDSSGKTSARFTGEATIDRKDWGVVWNAFDTFLVADQVRLEVEVVAVKADRDE